MRSHASTSDLFKGRHFEQEIIILCVRWYLRYKLSYRDLVEMMAERGLPIAHTTILRWVQRYAPEFDKRWSRFATSAGTSWRVDETYVRIRGQWAYLYRAVDSAGNTVDFRLSPRRNVASAKAFFRKAIRSQGRSPETITLDGYAASHRAVRELQERGRLPEMAAGGQTYPQFLWENHQSRPRKLVGMRVTSACTSITQFRAALA